MSEKLNSIWDMKTQERGSHPQVVAKEKLLMEKVTQAGATDPQGAAILPHMEARKSHNRAILTQVSAKVTQNNVKLDKVRESAVKERVIFFRLLVAAGRSIHGSLAFYEKKRRSPQQCSERQRAIAR